MTDELLRAIEATEEAEATEAEAAETRLPTGEPATRPTAPRTGRRSS